MYRTNHFARHIPGWLVAVAALFAVVPLLNAQSPEWLQHRGSRKLLEQDFDGAILDFSRAIYLNPNYAFAYNNRGVAKSHKGNFNGAIADFSKAFQLDPLFAEASYNCGAARMKLEDYDGAIVDFNKAIGLAPESWHVFTGFTLDVAYNGRGCAYQCKGDFVDSMADFDRAIAMKPKKGALYFQRGVGRDILGDFAAAQADYDMARSLGETEYVDLLRYVVGLRTNQGGFDLEAAMAKWKKTKPLTKAIGAFLAGHLSEEKFLEAAGGSGSADIVRQRCVASYFAGMKRLFSGDEAGARALLEQSLASNKPGCYEYNFARAEMDRLGSVRK